MLEGGFRGQFQLGGRLQSGVMSLLPSWDNVVPVRATSGTLHTPPDVTKRPGSVRCSAGGAA